MLVMKSMIAIKINDYNKKSRMKACFSEEFKKLFKNLDPQSNQAEQLHHFCVQVAIFAWQIKASIISCLIATKQIDIFRSWCISNLQ